MTYLCPKCGQPMVCVSTASIPPIVSYQCFGCGYSSKPKKHTEYYAPLPVWLRSDEKNEVDE